MSSQETCVPTGTGVVGQLLRKDYHIGQSFLEETEVTIFIGNKLPKVCEEV